MTVENFVRIVWTVFAKIEKSRKMAFFLAIFGLILAMFLTPQQYEFDEIAHKGPYYGVENDCRKFRSNRMDSFCENRKMSKNGCFLGHFWANFGYVSHIPVTWFWCHCAHRGPFGCRMTVQNFMKILWKVFENFEIFINCREKNKKNDTIA